MENSWEKVKIGEVLTFQRGHDLTHNEMKGGKIPVVGSSEIIGYHDEAKVKAPVLLIGRSGTVGRPQFYEQDIWAHNTTLFVNDFHENDPKFCFYFLKNLNLQDYACASGVPTLNRNFIHPLEVNFPPLPTQHRIATVLSCLDEKIALNNRINDNLEAMAKAVFEQLKIMNYELKDGKVKDIIADNKTGDWGKETEQGNYTKKVTCIRGTDIKSMFLSTGDKAPERFVLEKNSHKILQNGDFVIEISGGSPTQSTGRIACITDDLLASYENPLICSNFCKAISLKDENLFYYFYFQWQNWYDNGLFFGYEGKTSGIKNFLFDNFANSQAISILPQEILQNFNTIVKPLFSMIIKNKRESEQLSKFRNYLLPLLMNGQVSVNYHLSDC
jgi:type I restriction enzyme S subunit